MEISSHGEQVTLQISQFMVSSTLVGHSQILCEVICTAIVTLQHKCVLKLTTPNFQNIVQLYIHKTTDLPQVPQCPAYMPPFCNLSASQKRRRGLYAGSDILSPYNVPMSTSTYRCGTRRGVYTQDKRPIEAGSTPICLCFSRPQKLDGQDQLTEAGHSVDGDVFKVLRGFVLSMCYSTDTTREHTCDRWQIPQLFSGHWLHSCVATPPRRP